MQNYQSMHYEEKHLLTKGKTCGKQKWNTALKLVCYRAQGRECITESRIESFAFLSLLIKQKAFVLEMCLKCFWPKRSTSKFNLVYVLGTHTACVCPHLHFGTILATCRSATCPTESALAAAASASELEFQGPPKLWWLEWQLWKRIISEQPVSHRKE